MLGRNYQKFYPLLWLLIGIFWLLATLHQSLTGAGSLEKVDLTLFIPAVFGLLAVMTGIAYIKAWRMSRLRSRLSGSFLIMCSLVLILFGVEDVGGPSVAMPLGLTGIAFGAWSTAIRRRRQKH